MMAKLDFDVEIRKGFDSDWNRTVEVYVQNSLRTQYTVVEEMITERVVDLLRERGWTVTPPSEEIK